MPSTIYGKQKKNTKRSRRKAKRYMKKPKGNWSQTKNALTRENADKINREKEEA